MNGKFEISDVELHAFIDGALDGERFREVEVGIAADPALAGRIAAYRSDMEMLKRVYAPLIDQPLPKEWLARIQSSKAPARSAMSWRLVGSIAATLLIVLGMAAFWQMRPAGEIVQAALDARGHEASAERVIAIDAGTNARQYDSVLRAAVAVNVKVPDLSRMGYRLSSIRVYPKSPAGRAAELRYRNTGGQLFTLYVRRSDGTARFDQFERDGLRVCVWQDEQLSAVMAGNVSTAAMQRLASLAYTGLTL